MNVLISLLIAVLVGGGVTFVANKSLPGDVLYSVKTSFNDNVLESFAFSSEGKAGVHVDIAEDRLEEAEKIVVDGSLKADVRAQLEANFKAHADRVAELVAKLLDSDAAVAAKVASDFETSLKAHEDILAQLSTDSNDDVEKTEIEKINAVVKARAEAAEAMRKKAETKLKTESSVEVKSAAEGRIGAAENKIAEVKKYLASVKARLGAEATADAEARLVVAESTLAQANAQLSAQAFGDAFLLASQAHRIAQDAKLLATNRLELDTDLEIDGESRTGLSGRLPSVLKGDDEDETEDEVEGENRADAKLEINVEGESDDLEVNGDLKMEADLDLK